MILNGESNKIAVLSFPRWLFFGGGVDYRLSIPVVADRSDSFLETVFGFSVAVGFIPTRVREAT